LASTWQPGRSVERVATDLNKAILLAYNKHAPERRVEVKKKSCGKPSETLFALRIERNKCRRNGKENRFKELRNKCTSLGRKEALLNAQKKLLKDPNYAWKCLSKLTGKQSSDGIQVKKDDKWCSDQEAANELNSYFIKKGAKLQKSMQNASADPLEGPRRRAKAKGIKQLQLHTALSQ
jgi:hypothetical protein